jgi:hypothetical protein
MIPRVVGWLEQSPTSTVAGLSIVLLIIIGAIDYKLGSNLSVTPFYLVPIGLIALRWDRRSALVMAMIAGLAPILMGRYSRGMNIWPDMWNSLTRAGIFVLFALVLSRIKGDIMNEMKLNADLQAALAEVKQLSGLLPICAWCKRIRDEAGSWEPIESYISVHSEADFTHGICPDCARKYHPKSSPQ